MILPGSAPSMSSRTIRVINSQVLPLPAEADTVAFSAGLQASRLFVGLLITGMLGVYRLMAVQAIVFWTCLDIPNEDDQVSGEHCCKNIPMVK